MTLARKMYGNKENEKFVIIKVETKGEIEYLIGKLEEEKKNGIILKEVNKSSEKILPQDYDFISLLYPKYPRVYIPNKIIKRVEVYFYKK